MTKSKINLKSKLESIKDYWSPKVIAELNDYQFKLAKIKDEFIWHEHNDTDEAFMVIEGNIEIELDQENYNLGKNYDFSEICITSSAKIINTKKNDNSIKVNTVKAEGQKCPVCWKINKNGCERHSCSNKN